MRVTILTSDRSHPVHEVLLDWAASVKEAAVEVVTRLEEARGGDFLFLISCHDLVRADIRARYRHCLVVHASPLPRGRGWSPLVWAVLEGRAEFTVTLLEAAERVDSGAIWAQEVVPLQGHELYDELNELLFAAELRLMARGIREAACIQPRAQNEADASYYRRRTPDDSRLDPQRSITEQFELLRVCDPERFPAFFEHRGYRYALRLSKIGPVGDAPSA